MAKEGGGRVLGLHVIQPFMVFAYDVQMIESADFKYMAQAQERADRYLAAIEKACKEQGVDCCTLAVTDERPYEAIIRTAKARSCDLIMMASHGRSGIKGVLLGSETQKVLTHSTVPVLGLR